MNTVGAALARNVCIWRGSHFELEKSEKFPQPCEQDEGTSRRAFTGEVLAVQAGPSARQLHALMPGQPPAPRLQAVGNYGACREGAAVPAQPSSTQEQYGLSAMQAVDPKVAAGKRWLPPPAGERTSAGLPLLLCPSLYPPGVLLRAGLGSPDAQAPPPALSALGPAGPLPTALPTARWRWWLLQAVRGSRARYVHAA